METPAVPLPPDEQPRPVRDAGDGETYVPQTDAAASGHQNPTPREATSLHMPTCDDANCQGCMPEPSFRVPHPGGLAEDFDAKRATRINIAWDDGLRHQFDRMGDGSWLLHLTNAEGGPTAPSISGYTRTDMWRVLETALDGTPTGAAASDPGDVHSQADPPTPEFRADPWNRHGTMPIRRRTPPESMRYVAEKLREEADAQAGPQRGRLIGHAITLETFADEMEADSSIHALPYIRSLIPELDLEDLRQVEADVAAHMPRRLRERGRTAEAMVGGVRVPPPGADAVGRFEEIVRSLREAASHAVPITVRDIDAISDLGHEMAVAVVEAAEVTTGVSRIHLWQVTAWMENMNPARDHRHFRLLVATPGRDFLSHRERIEAMILDEWERRAEASGRYTVHIQGFWALKSGFEGHELGPTALHIGGADESA